MRFKTHNRSWIRNWVRMKGCVNEMFAESTSRFLNTIHRLLTECIFYLSLILYLKIVEHSRMLCTRDDIIVWVVDYKYLVNHFRQKFQLQSIFYGSQFTFLTFVCSTILTANNHFKKKKKSKRNQTQQKITDNNDKQIKTK